ncbi:MAG: GumC family protein [Gemmatimonadaceae bacterium]
MSSNLPTLNQPADTPPPTEYQEGGAPQAWQGYTAEPRDSGVPWARYLSAIKRYKWLILLMLIAGGAVGAVLPQFLIKPEYQARATVWIQADQPTGVASITPAVGNTPNAWVEVLTSRRVISNIVRKRQLYLSLDRASDSLLFATFEPGARLRAGYYKLLINPGGTQYTLTTIEDDPIEHGAVGDSVGRSLGFKWVPPSGMLRGGEVISFRVSNPEAAAQWVAGQLNAFLPEYSNTMRLSLVSSDGQLAASTLNALQEEFVAIAKELKQERYTQSVKVLEKQLLEAEQSLREKELAYERFRTQTITMPSEGAALLGSSATTESPVMGSYFEMRMRADQLRNDRELLERIVAQTPTGGTAADVYLMVPAVQTGARDLRAGIDALLEKEKELRAARAQYTEEHSTVRELVGDVRTLRTQTIPELARQYSGLLRNQERELGSRLRVAEGELRRIPERSIREESLRMEKEIAARLYTELRDRYAQAQLAALSTSAEVTPLDTAIAPMLPSNANAKARLMLMVLAASLAGGIGLALLLDRVDPRFRYPEQVSEEMGLSILGAVPRIKKRRHGLPDSDEAAQVIESFRSLRLNIAHAYNSVGPVLLTITSPGSGDGKSLISANLALSFAEAGYRTLLVDGDIRRGELHAMFGANRRPGLVDYLVGEAPLEAILRNSVNENLTLVPCGTRRHRGPELLVSEKLANFIADMRPRYDVIVVDSPPLGAGIDPFVLGTATGNLLMVFRTGASDRKMAEAKLKMLEKLPIRILGAVLNDVQTVGVYRYYSYLYGYTAADEETPRLESKVGELTGRV